MDSVLSDEILSLPLELIESPFDVSNTFHSEDENGREKRRRIVRKSEEKRRKTLNSTYDEMVSLVPSLNVLKKPTKIQIVQETVKYLRTFRNEVIKQPALLISGWDQLVNSEVDHAFYTMMGTFWRSEITKQKI
eukprot:TRINITY_DN7433_c0_g1_i2.p1 TRINITY_DN7433_c0_g1~~TRINITY_DN7433_c0_g1_i2.p1  ORF type:complete len:134 (-),score=32.16 TRINITY_DN7433_c0_g1_i2:304-705(-)